MVTQAEAEAAIVKAQKETGLSREEIIRIATARKEAREAAEREAAAAPPPTEEPTWKVIEEVKEPAVVEAPVVEEAPPPSWKVIEERVPAEVVGVEPTLAAREEELARYEERARVSEAGYERYRKYYEEKYVPAYEREVAAERVREERYFVELREQLPELTKTEFAELRRRYTYLKGERLSPEDFERMFGYALKGAATRVAPRREAIAREPTKEPFTLGQMEYYREMAGTTIEESLAKRMGKYGIGLGGLVPAPPREIAGFAGMAFTAPAAALEEAGMFVAGVFAPEKVAMYKPAPSPWAIATVPEYRERYGMLTAVSGAMVTLPLEAKATGPIFRAGYKVAKPVIVRPARWVGRRALVGARAYIGEKPYEWIARRRPVAWIRERAGMGEYYRTVRVRKGVPQIKGYAEFYDFGEEVGIRARLQAKYIARGPVRRIDPRRIMTTGMAGAEYITPEEQTGFMLARQRQYYDPLKRRVMRGFERVFLPERYRTTELARRVHAALRPAEAVRYRRVISPEKWSDVMLVRTKKAVGVGYVTPEKTGYQIAQLKGVPRREILKVYGIRPGIERELARLERAGEFARFGKPKMYYYPRGQVPAEISWDVSKYGPRPMGEVPVGTTVTYADVVRGRGAELAEIAAGARRWEYMTGLKEYVPGPRVYGKGIHLATGRSPEEVAKTFYHEVGHAGGISAKSVGRERLEELAERYAAERVRERFYPTWAAEWATELPEREIIGKRFIMYRAEVRKPPLRRLRGEAEIGVMAQLPREEAARIATEIRRTARTVQVRRPIGQRGLMAPQRFYPTTVAEVPSGLLPTEEVLPEIWMPAGELPEAAAGAVIGRRAMMQVVPGARQPTRMITRPKVRMPEIGVGAMAGMYAYEREDAREAVITAPILKQITRQIMKPPPPPPKPPVIDYPRLRPPFVPFYPLDIIGKRKKPARKKRKKRKPKKVTRFFPMKWYPAEKIPRWE